MQDEKLHPAAADNHCSHLRDIAPLGDRTGALALDRVGASLFVVNISGVSTAVLSFTCTYHTISIANTFEAGN
jgi:hypothetical protein